MRRQDKLRESSIFDNREETENLKSSTGMKREFETSALAKDGIIEDRVLLEVFIRNVFQITMPKNPAVWGISDEDMRAHKVPALPPETFFKDRCTKTDMRAISPQTCDAVDQLTELCCAGCIKKSPANKDFSPHGFCDGMQNFIFEVCGKRLDELLLKPTDSKIKHLQVISVNAKCAHAIFRTAEKCSRENGFIQLSELKEVVHSIIDAELSDKVLDDLLANELARYAFMHEEVLHLEEVSGSHATLSSIYIEPDYAISLVDGTELKPQASLHELLNSFAHGKVSSVDSALYDSTRVITVLGHPGLGKTSLVASLAAGYKKRTFCPEIKNFYCLSLNSLIPLQFHNAAKPIQFVARKMGLSIDDVENSLIVLDGLDELSMVLPRGESINAFYHRLIDDAKTYDNCRVIITSRYNYINTTNIKQTQSTIIELKPFTVEKAKRLIAKIEATRKTPISQATIDHALESFERFDFLAVPLLLYTVMALDIDVAKTDGMGALYDQAFAEVAKIPLSNGLDANHVAQMNARKIAKMMATEMRRKGRCYLTPEEAQEVLSRFGWEGLSDEEMQLINSNYAVSFFYRDSKTNHFAPEFMHRTFAEFLAAEEIYERLCEDIELGDVEGMEAWWQDFDYLLGMETLTDQVLSFIKYKITASEADGDKIANTLCDWFFETYLPAGMLYRAGRKTGESSIEKSYVLLASWPAPIFCTNQNVSF